MSNHAFGIVLILCGVALMTISVFGSNYAGINAENDRLYQKCLSEKQEMVYNEAVGQCKERVK